MKLTIASKSIALPIDAKISIEKTSPLLNDDTGSFSYPFPVPTAPNQHTLGWPGKLQRTGDIPDQTFILEEGGLQVMRGEISYDDDINGKEIGIILKSGYTEFFKKMEGKKLDEIDFGSESWPITDGSVLDLPAINAKMAEWNLANTVDNGKYVLSQFVIGMQYAAGDLYVNKYFHTSGDNGIRFIYSGSGLYYASYCLQFKMHFVIRKIFESAGYTIAEEVLSESDFFSKLILFGNIITITPRGTVSVTPVMSSLQYATLMPDIKVIDFLNSFKTMFCLMYEIDERKKEVRIKFKKDVFLPENLDSMKITELTGWMHKEEKTKDGFTLRYTSQDDDLDTYTDFPMLLDTVSTLPAPTQEDKILHVSQGIRDYITQSNNDVLEWKEVGRLHEVRVGDGENDVEINAKVPAQKQYKILNAQNEWTLECPFFKSLSRMANDKITTIPYFAITLYHGMKIMSGISIPYASFDRFSIDVTIDTGISLKPSYLYDTLYSKFLNWQTYRARAFTKYIELSLVQLLALQWGKRYNIDGIEVILDKINSELPHYGTVKVKGYTA